MEPPDFYAVVDRMEGCSPVCDAGDLHNLLLMTSRSMIVPPAEPHNMPKPQEVAHRLAMLELFTQYCDERFETLVKENAALASRLLAVEQENALLLLERATK